MYKKLLKKGLREMLLEYAKKENKSLSKFLGPNCYSKMFTRSVHCEDDCFVF